jgi:hypothetical protein
MFAEFLEMEKIGRHHIDEQEIKQEEVIEAEAIMEYIEEELSKEQ